MVSVRIPLLSDHCITLVRNRLLETLTGGVTFIFNPEWIVSKWFYLLQIGLHQLPFFVGSVFTALIESKMTSTVLACVLCSITMALITFCIQIATLRYLAGSLTFRLSPESNEFGDKHSHFQDKVKISQTDLETPDQTLTEMVSNQLIIAHIFPPKRRYFNYIFRPVCCGLLTGYGVVYLLPSTLFSMYHNEAISYAIFALGWLTLCASAYSLTAHPPVEPAVFTVVDRWEIKPYMRSFYVGIFYLIDIICRFGYSVDLISNAIAHLLFTLVPLLWFLNIFPPLDALLIWILEQVNIWLAGGSTAADNKARNLIIQVFIWSGVIALIYLIPKQIALVLCSVFGYVMSLNLVTIHRSIRCWRQSVWDIFDLFFFGATFVAVTFLAIMMYFLVTPYSFQLDETVIFAFTVILFVIYVIIVFTSSGQCVYVFGGFLRNCLYPKNVRNKPELRRLSQLKHLGRIRCVLVSIAAPLVIVVYVTLTENFKVEEKVSKTWYINLLRCIAVVRAFRWPWQQTESALLELIISYVVVRYTKLLGIFGCFSMVFLLISFLMDRLWSIKSKLRMICLLMISCVLHERQKRPHTGLLFVLNVLFYPVVLAVVVVASFINAPVLSLFTLPIFWIGFPRPISFWPIQKRTTQSVSQDSVYYEEIIPSLTKALSEVFSSGILGNVHPGEHYFLRFEDRMFWLSTVESGYGYLKVVLKGLELQHTSCHALEATEIDGMIDKAFEVELNHQSFNHNPFHVYTPKTVTFVETYVDTSNDMTEFFKSSSGKLDISRCFSKCLIWILLTKITDKSYSVENLVEEKFSSQNSSPEKERKLRGHLSEPKTISEKIFNCPETVVGETSLTDFQLNATSEQTERSGNKVETDEEDNDDDDPWKDEADLLGSPPPRANEMKQFVSLVDHLVTNVDNLSKLLPQLPGSVYETSDSSFAQQQSYFEFPQPPHRSISPQQRKNSMESLDFLHYDVNETCLPDHWLTSPILPEKLYRIEDEFPLDFFIFMWKKRFGETNSPSEGVIKIYKRVILTCLHYVCFILKDPTTGETECRLMEVHFRRLFCGIFSWWPSYEWFMEKQLSKLSITAIKYAVKATLDTKFVGDIETYDDLIERFEEFDQEWFFGPETDPTWAQGIRDKIPNLFTLKYSDTNRKTVLSTHLLKRRATPIYIGSLNRDAVHTVWSTLNLEMLYFANDDEERYSIQGHTTLLRNLSVQAADPPLGYPIYVTEPIFLKLIPTLIISRK
ncbi:Pecanex-like protein 4 [Chamberlinius hualienensis]